MTGMVGDTHPEITVHFQAWINTEPSTDYVECTGVICFPCLSKTLFRYDGGISMVEDITSTSTTPLKHLVAMFTTKGVGILNEIMPAGETVWSKKV